MAPGGARRTCCFTAGAADRYPSAIATLSDVLDLPKPFGPYVLLRRLAVGGMAEVYVAKAKGIGGFEKLVAIKVIHPRFSADAHFVRMLVEEAKIAVQLNHVNIAQTFDLGCIDDTYYIAMELIEGADAFRVGRRAREKKLPIPIDICCYAAAEVCSGLSYAHRKRDAEGNPLGIVHRDVSPQNVLISYAGEVKLVDFGIAKAASRGGETEVGVIKGKYYYMSPEQAWGDPVDQRTDVFATGLLLHELLTGQMVYRGDNIATLLDGVRKADIPSPRALRADVPEALEDVVMKALAKEASDRFQSAHAFGQELARVLYDLEPAFTAPRLGQLMATLFPEEVRRNSQLLPLPQPAPCPPSGRVELDPMSREEFAGAEDSMIFDLGALQNLVSADADDSTRNDILPFKRKPTAAAPTAPEVPRPRARRPSEEASTAELLASRDEWDEETLLKGKDEWEDDSTLVEGADEAMNALLAFRGRAEPLEDLAGEKTVATAQAAPLFPDDTATEALAGEPTVSGAPSLPTELPGEKTLGWSEDSAVSASRKHASILAPSKAAVKLGPAADRFFAPVSGDHQALSGLDHPFASAPEPPPSEPLTHDPFIAQPQPNLVEPLGKPEPKRWLLPAGFGVLALALVIGLGTWLATGSKPTSLEIISVPEGATVQIDGRTMAGVTPLTVPDIEPGVPHRVRLSHPGYEPHDAVLTANEGTNRTVTVLRQIRVSLRVETRPPGAQVWVDNLLRGSAPLDIPGLAVGQTLLLRSAAPGHVELSRELTLDEDDPAPSITLELTPADVDR